MLLNIIEFVMSLSIIESVDENEKFIIKKVQNDSIE